MPARMWSHRASVRTTLAAALVLTLSSAAGAGGRGIFDPRLIEYAGPQLVTFVDSNAAPVRCVQLAAETRDYLLMLAGLVAPIVACSAFSTDRQQCTVVAPISGGLGQALAAVTTLNGPDELLGHEFRHCRDHDFHPTMLPFVESPP